MCDQCTDRLWKLLQWMGYKLEGQEGIIVLRNSRGAVHLRIDASMYHTRVALMAIFIRLVHGGPSA